MREMIDQWAFGLLMVLYNVLGIQDIPPVASQDWKVVERWTEQPGQYYKLEIVSQSIPELCRQNPTHFVVFPQTYMGQQEIYADDLMVYTNSMGQKWNLSTILDRPIVSCHLLAQAQSLKLVTFSYLKFFASINSWPYMRDSYPKDQVFYSKLNMILGILIFVISVLFFIVLAFVNDYKFSLFFLGLSALCFEFTQVPFYLFNVSMQVNHSIFLLSLLVMIYFFIEQYLRSTNWSIIFLVFLSIFPIILYGQKNALQTLIIIISTLFLLYVLYLIFFNFEKRRFENTFLKMIFLAGILDIYRSVYMREGNFNLFFIVSALFIFGSIKLIEEFRVKHKQIVDAESKIELERNLIIKTISFNDFLQELIHDLKSPITTLNFSKDEFAQNKPVALAVNRINEIMSKASNHSVKNNIDWFSLKIIIAAMDTIVLEKRSFIKEVEVLDCNINMTTEVLVDLNQFKICIAELIDNSIKANPENLRLKIMLKVVLDGALHISYEDFGKKTGTAIIDLFGLKGFTTAKGGRGLYGVIKKIRSFGGEIEIYKKHDGLLCQIKLISRTR